MHPSPGIVITIITIVVVATGRSMLDAHAAQAGYNVGAAGWVRAWCLQGGGECKGSHSCRHILRHLAIPIAHVPYELQLGLGLGLV